MLPCFLGKLIGVYTMKSAQIAIGSDYEDRGAEKIRTVTAIFQVKGGGHSVHYTERSATTPSGRGSYWNLQNVKRTHQTSLSEFAEWAARAAGAKSRLSEKKFTDWVKEPPHRQFAKSR